MARSLVRTLVSAIAVVAVGLSLATPAAASGSTGSISGTVIAPAGVSPAGIPVSAYGSGPAELHDAVTRADGTYTIVGLPNDDYYVVAGGTGSTIAPHYAPGTTVRSNGTRTPVRGAAVTGVDIRVTAGAFVSGTITSDSDCDVSKVAVTVIGGPASRQVTQFEDQWYAGPLAAPTTYKIRFDGRFAGIPEVVYWPAGDMSDPTSWATLLPGTATTDQVITLHGPTHGCLAPQDYVEQLYLDLLGRVGDPSSVSGWVNAIVYQGASGTTIANAFTSSDEFRLGMIGDVYDGVLGREADSSGQTFWLSRMRAGVQIEDIEAGFIASDEFYAQAGGTPAGWVSKLYDVVLGRTPSDDEVRWWVTAIGNGMNRGTVARGFLYSTENLTSAVDSYYEWLLGRPIDPVGARDWVALIQHGHRDEEIIAGIVSSDEYRGTIVG